MDLLFLIFDTLNLKSHSLSEWLSEFKSILMLKLFVYVGLIPILIFITTLNDLSLESTINHMEDVLLIQ